MCPARSRQNKLHENTCQISGLAKRHLIGKVDMKVEAAFDGEKKLIGYRLTAGDQSLLVFENWPSGAGFRLGSEFVPRIGEIVAYVDVSLDVTPN